MGFNYNESTTVSVSTDIMAMLCRQAAWPYWVNTSTVNANDVYYVTYVVNMPFGGIASTTANAYYTAYLDTAVNYWKVGNQTASAALLGITGGNVPTYQYPVIGVDAACGPLPFVYVPGSSSYSIVFTNGAAISAGTTVIVRLSLEFWSSPGEVTQSATTYTMTVPLNGWGANVALTTTAGNNAWVRISNVELSFPTGAAVVAWNSPQMHIVVSNGTISYSNVAANRGVCNVIGGVTFSGIVPGQYPVEFTNSQIPWYSTRVTAVSALYTNVTQVLNKSGTVLAGRIAPQQYNPFLVTSAMIGSLHPAEKAYLPLETGHYTYCPPSTDLQDFWDYTLNTASGAAACPVYRLDNTSLVNIAFFNAPVVEQLAVNLDWHIEFRTTSALFQVGLSTSSIESLHQAQLALSSLGYFFPNETHKSLIGRVLGATSKWASMVFPTMAKMVPYANTALTVAKGAHDLLFEKKPKPPPTTSAAGSGIVSNRKKKAKAKPKAKVAKKRK